MAHLAPVAVIGLAAYMLERNSNAQPSVEQFKDKQPETVVAVQSQLPDSGAVAGMQQYLLNQHFYDTERPSERWWPVAGVPVDNAAFDPVQHMYDTQAQLQQASTVRGMQKVWQQQADTRSSRNRGIVNSFTHELQHPLTGESTRFVQHAFVPKDANEAQRKRANRIASARNAHTYLREPSQQYYQRAPHQSFRHSSKK